VKWGAAYSVAIRPKLKKEARMSSDAKGIPEKVDTGFGGSNNVHALFAALTNRWSCMGVKCNTNDIGTADRVLYFP